MRDVVGSHTKNARDSKIFRWIKLNLWRSVLYFFIFVFAIGRDEKPIGRINKKTDLTSLNHILKPMRVS